MHSPMHSPASREGDAQAQRKQAAAVDSITPISTHLSIQRRDDARGVVITLSGDLDIVSAPELEQLLSELLAEDHPRVLVDLNKLSFVDSAGVSVLIRVKRQAETTGRRLLLRRPTAQLHRVFAVVGLAEWLDFED
jgi:anti-sigma B factor antagonist